jgi:CheY-like chemotaxis protein
MQVVLMDLMMPVMDGLEATRVIRSLQLSVPPGIIALTADIGSGQRSKCYEAGMNDFLTKPIQPQQLKASLLKSLSALPTASG